jgi:S-DNA-T family DNA segregation ATPase FtsK/SpoIIIE
VLLVDNYAALTAAHGEPFGQGLPEDLLRIYSEGPGVAIHTVVTADRIGAIPAALASLTQQKIILQLADPLDYTSVALSSRTLPAFTPGRGLLPPVGLELQIATPSELTTVAAAAPQRPEATAAAPRIAVLPTQLFSDDLPSAICDSHPWTVPIGVADATLEEAVLPVYDGEHIMITGPPRSGRSTTLATLATQLRAASNAPILYGIALRPSALRDVPGLHVATTNNDALATLEAAALAAETSPVVLLIDDADQLGDLDEVVGRLLARRLAGCHLGIAARNDALRSLYAHWTQEVRKSRLGILLRPDVDLDGALLAVQLPRRPRANDRPGLGYLAVNGDAALVQFASPKGRRTLSSHTR